MNLLSCTSVACVLNVHRAGEPRHCAPVGSNGVPAAVGGVRPRGPRPPPSKAAPPVSVPTAQAAWAQ
eukprot:9467450-Pyramimonas_sp.AAC.1